MKKILICSALLLNIISCNTKKSVPVESKVITPSPVLKNVLTAYDNLLGAYTGVFGTDKITLLISNIYKDSILGRFIIGDRSSEIKGQVKGHEGMYKVITNDPVSKNRDGTFSFLIDQNADLVKAAWASSNPNNGSNTDYVLKRKLFQYNPHTGEYKASQKLLQTSDVENLMKNELEIMRNEIFARHGYCFTKENMREYFENEDWYIPNSKDIKDKLTPTEKKNIALIMRFEKYADEYGDDFGR